MVGNQFIHGVKLTRLNLGLGISLVSIAPFLSPSAPLKRGVYNSQDALYESNINKIERARNSLPLNNPLLQKTEFLKIIQSPGPVSFFFTV